MLCCSRLLCCRGMGQFCPPGSCQVLNDSCCCCQLTRRRGFSVSAITHLHILGTGPSSTSPPLPPSAAFLSDLGLQWPFENHPWAWWRKMLQICKDTFKRDDDSQPFFPNDTRLLIVHFHPAL